MKPFVSNISIRKCVKVLKKKLKFFLLVNNIFCNFTFFFKTDIL